ncbi:enhancer of split m7 protein [Drosophila subobscura]|uniref:enhancer of split m7 protein n=1 Tax=Drosophila subobscura TaxID=7241 RepID=UPI00155B0248|nr:enhancer of split m7 protein [Drosophila subobscura]
MATKYEVSKTYQYRKVMKPLLERRRRARINMCLDELKALMAQCTVQSGDGKFDRADILEVTVEHLRKLKQARIQAVAATAKVTSNTKATQSFRHGFIRAADEVSRALASLPNVDVVFGTHLMTHLGMRLNQLEMPVAAPRPMNFPLSIICGKNSNNSIGSNGNSSSSMAPSRDFCSSPVSSGYCSDSECSVSSMQESQLLLQISTAQIWRPW